MADIIHDDTEQSRFELDLGGRDTAFVTYRLTGETITLTHTEVPTSLREQGIGARLVVAVMHALRPRGLRVVPACGFAAKVIAAHPEFADLVNPPEGRARQRAAARARLDARLDEALEETFPASDPIAIDSEP
ncbi:MAG: GNAT family N-acetyltransferase [Variibacter sp.]